MIPKQIVGIATPRVEGEEKVSGRAVYAADVTFPDMLWARVLRSPIPHGHIKRIDTGQALKLPGVKAVITGKDIAGSKIGKKIIDMPLLAEDVVRFVGEKVAAAAAESEEIADQALDLVKVGANQNGGAEIWASTKSPFALRDQIANALRLSPQKLVVHPCCVGGDFGGKGDPLCTVLSRRCGRPVKLVDPGNPIGMLGSRMLVCPLPNAQDEGRDMRSVRLHAVGKHPSIGTHLKSQGHH